MKHSGHAVVVGLDRSSGGSAAVEHAANAISSGDQFLHGDAQFRKPWTIHIASLDRDRRNHSQHQRFG